MEIKLWCNVTKQFYTVTIKTPVTLTEKVVTKARKDLAKELGYPVYTIDNLCY